MALKVIQVRLSGTPYRFRRKLSWNTWWCHLLLPSTVPTYQLMVGIFQLFTPPVISAPLTPFSRRVPQSLGRAEKKVQRQRVQAKQLGGGGGGRGVTLYLFGSVRSPSMLDRAPPPPWWAEPPNDDEMGQIWREIRFRQDFDGTLSNFHPLRRWAPPPPINHFHPPRPQLIWKKS